MSTLTEKLEEKTYYMSVSSKCTAENRLWLSLSGGLRHEDRSVSDIKRSVLKARVTGAQDVVVPENVFATDVLPVIVDEVAAFSMGLRVQVLASRFVGMQHTFSQLYHDHGICFDIVLDRLSKDFIESVGAFPPEALRWVLPGIKTFPVWEQLERLPQEWLERLYLYFPYSDDEQNIYSPREVRALVRKFVQKHPQYKVKTLPGVDVYESRIGTMEDLESLVEPIVRSSESLLGAEAPQVTVIIPTYNSESTLFKTLLHLQAQTNRRFEVIIVDDGSTDRTSERFLDVWSQYTFPLSYIYYPRLRARRMGDAQFRAGRARNLGVRWARGEILAFLDADILVPSTYIQTLLGLHAQADVVQWRREYLTQKASGEDQAYNRVNLQKDIYIPEGGYWHEFYKKSRVLTWPRLEDYWKYTCTYALSLPKTLFVRSGGFRRTYCFYGCEDTELGLQLSLMGARFYYEDAPVYHLYHHTERSEFLNSFLVKQELLKKSALIMYYNTLRPEVFKVFRYLIAPETLREKVAAKVLSLCSKRSNTTWF